MNRQEAYRAFIARKVLSAPRDGFDLEPSEIHPALKAHQRDIVRWAVAGGRRAIFTAFGLGKTLIQLEVIRLMLLKGGGKRGLVILPLGVKQEFERDAKIIDLQVAFVRTMAEAEEAGIYLTNYESVREGKIDPRLFDVVSLDEASCLRGFGGTKTFREFMRLFEGSGIPRFVATATPSPNDYIELLAYAAYLDIMDVGQAKTRFFKRNSEKADQLTIHPHKEAEFWAWLASWACFVQRPSDLGYSDEGYVMPELDVRWHCLPSDHGHAGSDKRGQNRLLADASLGVVEASRERRESLEARIAKVLELRAEDLDAHRIIWHDQECERKALERSIPGLTTVWGSQNWDEREAAIIAFSEGLVPELATKPVIAGSGCNFQRHCSWAIYTGIGYKFNDFIQSIHRLQRFLQTERVRIDLIYTEAEQPIRDALERKWRQHIELTENMTALIREHGLSGLSMEMVRESGCERSELSGKNWTMVRNDCVEECMAMDADSVDLIVTSIPFSSQYEYSPNFNDFGHSESNDEFWQQMGFLIPELLRVLKAGRVAAIHVKDRITPGGINGLGFQTLTPFSDETVRAFTEAGFGFLARKTIVTDVVRENAQTYRLGWTEQCKDGSRMGTGTPEYVLLFRKAPSDRSDGYADVPVVKSKDTYSRARWQFDAHAFSRSSGNRILQPEDLRGLSHRSIFRAFKAHSLHTIYDHEHDVELAESVDEAGMLPSAFMLLQPQSHHPDVWTDVTRMRTLNMMQSQQGRANHLCPLQFDIVDRLINQFSNEGEVIFDPFAGLGTVPLLAVKQGRLGLGVELNAAYVDCAWYYLQQQDHGHETPSLFAIEELPEEEALEIPA